MFLPLHEYSYLSSKLRYYPVQTCSVPPPQLGCVMWLVTGDKLALRVKLRILLYRSSTIVVGVRYSTSDTCSDCG